jgi:hypothetical protein
MSSILIWSKWCKLTEKLDPYSSKAELLEIVPPDDVI